LIRLELKEQVSELDRQFLDHGSLAHAIGAGHQFQGVGQADSIGFGNDFGESVGEITSEWIVGIMQWHVVISSFPLCRHCLKGPATAQAILRKLSHNVQSISQSVGQLVNQSIS